MLQGLVVAVVVLGGVVAVLSFGYWRLATSLENLDYRCVNHCASVAVRFDGVSGWLDAVQADCAALRLDHDNLGDAVKGLARPVVGEYLNKLSANAADVKAGIETKVFGD